MQQFCRCRGVKRTSREHHKTVVQTLSAPLLRDFSATPKRSMGNVELSRLINARSVTRSPRRRWRAQALIDAVLVTMHAGNKPARLEAFGQAIKSLTRYVRRARPQARISVASKRSRQEI